MCRSIKPGATTRPLDVDHARGGTVIDGAMRAIVSPRTATSPRYHGLPVPSTMRALRNDEVVWRIGRLHRNSDADAYPPRRDDDPEDLLHSGLPDRVSYRRPVYGWSNLPIIQRVARSASGTAINAATVANGHATA